MADQFNIVVEPEVNKESKRKVMDGARGIVVQDIMGDIGKWRQFRDGDFEERWTEYYFKWRGFWRPQDKTSSSEKSRLIAPLTSMAVDLTTAEILEAIFGREYFIDLPDDADDSDASDVSRTRKLLIEDLRKDGFIDETAKAILSGTLYGTGITKIQLLTKIVRKPFQDKDGKIAAQEVEEIHIKPVAVDPGQFVPDPGAECIDDMKGCAHEFLLPIHIIEQRQAEGIYDSSFKVGSYNIGRIKAQRGDTEMGNRRDKGEVAFITEYYGLVNTRHMMMAIAEANKKVIPTEVLAEIPQHQMSECIATIANETHLLRIILNPIITNERLIVSYQHETVPGSVWGRGVCEKGAHVQRAMDAEMRGRIDALRWSNSPMFAGDLNRMPPGAKLNAWPGKFWGTRGNPDEIIKEFRVSGPDPNSFQHMQDLERMGQQATGALDSIMSLRAGVRDETATGSAMSASGFIKRSKRTMYNIEGYMNRLIRRITVMKCQYDTKRYPQDYEFQVRGTVGIMAREIEQQFMVNLLGHLGPESPAAMPIIKAIFEYSGSPVKDDVLKALKALEEKEPTPQEQAAQEAALMRPVLENKKLNAETIKLFAEGALKDAQEDKTREEIRQAANIGALEAVRVFNDLQETENQVRQLDILEDKNQIEREKLRKQPSK